MKHYLIALLLIGTATGACRQRKAIKVEPQKTILPGKKVDVSAIYKKRSGDLVEALYDELVSGSAELTQLEQDIKALKQQAPDSLKDYKAFHEKNRAYYDLAVKKLNTLTDSTLRKKLQVLINQSRKQYADSLSQLSALDSLIARRTATINDLHTVLKLVKTLPLIEDFQRSNQPAARPAGNALRNLDSLVSKIDSLVSADSLAMQHKL
jgi:hypothetical protein